MLFLIVSLAILASSASAQLSDLALVPSEQQRQRNAPCVWQVSKRQSTSSLSSMNSPNVAFALEQECSDSYDIMLVGVEHIEGVTISNSVPVKISGMNTTAGKRMKFRGGFVAYHVFGAQPFILETVSQA
ncbi:MAG: hypothetical protein EZS28_051971, partial [Streblomastix strix]